eukprot:gene5657-15092_t
MPLPLALSLQHNRCHKLQGNQYLDSSQEATQPKQAKGRAWLVPPTYKAVKNHKVQRDAAYTFLSCFVGSCVESLLDTYFPAVKANDQRGSMWGLPHPGWILLTVVYKHVHRIHHLSKDPEPFSGLAFHPVESFLYFTALSITALEELRSIRRVVSIGLLLFPVATHHGFDDRLGLSRYHHDHHVRVVGNFGGFSLWDRVFGTTLEQRRKDG